LGADVISSRQEDLKRLKRRISQKQRERDQADEKEREISQEVSRISKELRSSRRSLKDVEQRIKETESRKADAEQRLWAANLDVGQWNGMLSAELRRLYERRAAAESGRFLEIEWRRRLARDKAAAMSDAVRRHDEIRSDHEALVAVESEFQDLKRRREEDEERVRQAKKDMTNLLATVQGRRAVIEDDLKELDASAKKFEKLIMDLIRERQEREAARAEAERQRAAQERKKSGRKAVAAAAKAPAAGPADFGKLPWPIEGAVVERFGKFKHPELDTVVVSNGIKIRPAHAGPVRAVGKGEVLFAGEFMGYGLMALVAHPDNLYTIYAQMGELKVKKGQRVSVGEVVGSSGTDAEDRPVFYFELRLHGEAMDPLLWLR
jgi:septal ring factor EnvC (AmiA/AmiB activator)